MIKGIYEDISHYPKNGNFKKLSLFFKIKEHSCDTLRYMPYSVFEEYLKMHLKEEVTSDDVYKLLEIDYKNTVCDMGGLSTNLFDYLSFYIDVKKLNRPKIIRHNTTRWKNHNFKEVIEESMSYIFDTREGKIFLWFISFIYNL